ncbi:DUF5615 family PIN-like protein [Rhodohalobacter sp.]|uniref:DUF5615 family PIN-like protein n=1 Tax=Rhodohalobacter sp. TaxID=1974210 RepID=UPI002ACD31DB|nr:DUF5615 family PIN-like protein [Rhodohalobacter sp.]MDZ7756223.1 DUF5615 family PIN-like protein [Rhodohalobacter sp.]
MKLLLDENIPHSLKKDLSEFEIFTVQDVGWQGKENGELLGLMLENDFQALITADKNLQSQQNFRTYPIPVLVLNVPRLTYQNIPELLPVLKEKTKKGVKIRTTYHLKILIQRVFKVFEVLVLALNQTA